MIQPVIIRTEDGSDSLFLPALSESYHSKFGALSESRHVFIEAGLKQIPRQRIINILEIGFGTGLNALITLAEAESNLISVNYHTVEPFPLSFEILDKLNYTWLPEFVKYQELFNKLHTSPYNSPILINDYFQLLKFKEKIEDISLEPDYYHLVYFDAFSPEVQPELWTADIFKKLFEGMTIGGILVTYSAKGLVRRNMQDAGFIVERLAGPKGKREMLRATKTIL